MLRHLFIAVCLLTGSGLAAAAEAGKVIFVAGKATVGGRVVAEGAPVQEGDDLVTGADGFIYIKTADSGLFILRPNTKAKIAAYHIDAKNPANTRIKLELISGVARSRSGDAVKLARQNFRFNTPVAAIGIRGTDFTVFTDQDTSRVAVVSGGVVVAGFGGACRPEGSGPCEGAASRELSAAQRGILLQIRRGQAAPQLLQGGAVAPDGVAPPRSDEPVAKNEALKNTSAIVLIQPSLDALKDGNLGQVKPAEPPVVAPPPVVGPVEPPVPDRAIVWGRWQPLLTKAANLDLVAEKAKGELIAVNGNYALFRSPGKEYVAPLNGKTGFVLDGGEAHIYTDNSWGRSVADATLSNGELNVDFGTKTFKTSMDLTSKDEQFKLLATGAITSDGRMFGDSSFSRPGYIDVQGVLSNEKGGAASYIFNGQLDERRSVNGVTYWRK